MPYFSVDSPQVLAEFPKHVWETSSDEHLTAYELNTVSLRGGRGRKSPKDKGTQRGH